MSKTVKRISVFVAILTVAATTAWHSDSVFAALTELAPVESFDRWAWSGTPVDQDGTEGVDGASSIGFLLLECDTAAATGPAVCSATSASTGYAYPSVRVDADPDSGTAGDIEGYMWFGTYGDEDSTGYPIGWIDLNPQPLATATYASSDCTSIGVNYPMKPCHVAQLDTNNYQEVTGIARIPTLACEGHRVLTGATTCDYTNPADIDNDWGWVLLRGNNSADDAEFGVLYRNGTLEGWAWAGGGSLPDGSYADDVALGWIDFSTGSTGSNTGPVGEGYLATEQGDVYVRDGITNPGGGFSPTQYQSTYLILSNGAVTRFSSESGSGYEDSSYTIDGNDLEVPDTDNDFRTDIGVIELEKLTTAVSGSENIYGQTIVTNGSGNLLSLGPTKFLDGSVYVFDNGNPSQNYVANRSFTFTNGTSATPSSPSYNGSGTIVINGNLTIERNMFYNNTDLQDIKNLASVAWIVRGDLTIAENVSNIVGNFFVLGDDSVDGDGDGVVNYGDGDGVIYTVAPTTGTNGSQLVVYGLMMARKFDLNRNYEGLGNGPTSGEDEPSELIIYDGRIVANTPPGFQDFSSLLPTFGSDE